MTPLRHRLELWGFLFARAMARVLPERLALALGSFLGWAAGGVFRIRRRVAEANVALAFPERPEAWRGDVVRGSYRHLGREAMALLSLLDASSAELRERTEVSGLEELETARARGPGALVVTGHYGNWEIGGAALAARGVPLEVVGLRQANRLFDDALYASREALGMRVIRRGRAPARVPPALREGKVVALLADQDWRSAGVFVDYFGTPASTARGPALFALRTGAPLFVGVARALSGPTARYRIELERVPFQPGSDLEDDVLELTRAYTVRLERFVETDPRQYFWQHKRWKTRPPAGHL